MQLYQRHQVIIMGESHNCREHKEFVIDLIPVLYEKANVRTIGWEFSRYGQNDRLNELVTAPAFNREAMLDFARDQFFHDWNSKEHWDIIEAVWRLNRSLKPGQQTMRLIGLQGNFDWTNDDLTSIGLQHDRVMAEQVEKNMMGQDTNSLVFVGRCHDFTHYAFPPSMNMGRPIMGKLLHDKYGDRVFQIWLGDAWPSILTRVLKSNQAPIGFDMWRSPLAEMMTPPGWDAPRVPWEKVARGYVYLGPVENMHAVTPLKGFITERLFTRYRASYCKYFERDYKNASEVDDRMQTRFSKPERDPNE